MGYPSEDRMFEDRDYCVDKAETVAAIARGSSQLPLASQKQDLGELHEVIEYLTQRVESVLTPVPTYDDAGKTPEDRKSMSPLAEELDNNNRSIRRATQKIRGLIERLEV